ncbi:AMP-binding protein [Nonomuraea rhizosphaerae]|uniref:AMP-binding protein n=1 Tax=Nonomuraea rhizosphaerae TaxID=2665663 RepID=UPI001C5E1CCF|nr:AMP-binding protein [Nonomuraea rhizosphaerae]
MSWTELVLSASAMQGDQPAVSDVRTGEALSYSAFARRVTHAAAGLRRHGLRYGDRVIINAPLGAGFAVAVHSVAWSGGVAVLNPSGTAPMMITQRGYDPLTTDVRQVFSFEPTPGALPFAELIGDRTVEFGPLAGPALSADGERVYDHDELATDLRALATRLVIGKDDVVLAAVSDPLKGLRVLDLAMMNGAHVVVANGPSLIGCRVLAHERKATLVIAPYELARRLLGDPTLRVVDERAVISSLAR